MDDGPLAQLDPDLAIVRGPPLTEEVGLRPLTLPSLLDEVTECFASREALVFHHSDGAVDRWTYSDLGDRSAEVVKALIACGCGKAEAVGLLMTNRPEWVSSCFGIAAAGGTVVGLSTFSAPAELEYLIRASGISTLLYEPRVLTRDFTAMLLELEPGIAEAAPGKLASAKFPFLRRLVALGQEGGRGAIEPWDAFLSRGEGIDPAIVKARASTVSPADPALLFFSSGSTGKPKGILNAHRGVAIQCWRYPQNYGFDHPVRTWSANGLFWSGNFALALGGTLASDGALILQATFAPGEAIRLMEAERVTLPYCWPHQWAQLEAEPSWEDADLSSFYYLDTERNLRRPQKSISTTWLEPRASYGATETFTISASFAVGTPRELWEGNNGAPLPGNTIKIVDPQAGRILRRGETGEIAVKGPTLMLGYIGVPREEAFDAEGFYRSGDGGHIDEQGRLFFAGRINDIVKTGGANVSPVEVDWILAACPGVKMCKTTGVPHETLGEMVVSLIVPEPGRELAEADALKYLKERLASYKVPRRILLIDEADLNLTGTAKIKPADARALALRKMAALDQAIPS
jgi:fatty-acyl-CoA synthase